MKETTLRKLEALGERLEELSALLGDASVIADQGRFRDLSREYSEIAPVVECFTGYLRAGERERATAGLLDDPDPEVRALADEELAEVREQRAEIEAELERLLLPADPDDRRNLFLEVRAGTGGDEACLFAGDLLRMYLRYAERHGWSAETVSDSPGEHGGHKEAVVRIEGRGAYARLKFESGGHRVQRVPETESQGRIHTSACTVAVLPEVEEVDEIELSPADLRIDTYRASGAGGQHVNKTDSAIRITHLPTNTVVECQDERSQHKNRARAMSLLRARLLDAERQRVTDERAETRRVLVGSGDRSQRIRTYNFPQGRVTDHRINLTVYKLADVLAGDLDIVIDPLSREHQADQLAALAD